MLRRVPSSVMLSFVNIFVIFSTLTSVVRGYRLCTDSSNFHERAAASSVIVHAKVAEIFGSLAELQIIKVYKGQELIDRLPKVVDMQGKKIIYINGVNTIGPACPSTVRRLQEKVWLADKGKISRELQLKYGVVHFTNEVKAMIDDVLKGKLPRKSMMQTMQSGQKTDPCKWKLCYLGGQCKSKDGVNAECVCSSACERLGASRRRQFLCGSDLRQYYSMCQLKEEACRSQRYIGVKFKGMCRDGLSYQNRESRGYQYRVSNVHRDEMNAFSQRKPQQDVPQKSDNYVDNTPCVEKKCSPNSKCIVKDGKASCVCQEICPMFYRPVCGSDGITYPNKCQLKRNSCARKRNTTIVHHASCSECKVLACKHHSRCEMDQRTRKASCRCLPESECPTNAENPVCGSDRVSYMSECHMKISACRQMKDINVVSQGACPEFIKPIDLCSNMECGYNSTCVQSGDLAACSCSHFECDNVGGEPVCGSDGNTYDNDCHFYRTRCNKQQDMKIIFQGKCPMKRNPCVGHKCSHPHEYCSVDRDMKPACLCPLQKCPKAFKPVCGSDMITYDNECMLKKLTCNQKKHVTINYVGPCSNINLCLKKHPECRSNEICRLSSNQNPVCECPTCPLQSSAMGGRVCGSDEKTYQHRCELYQKSCQEKKEVVVQNDGPCDLCKKKVCKNYAICKMDEYGRAYCVCPSTCVWSGAVKAKSNSPVCGSNGQTYESECFLRVQSCKSETLIEKIANGPCQNQSHKGKRSQKSCPNHCPMGSMCLNGRCVCRKKCSSLPMEVCGTDGYYYRNECEMKRVGCLRKINIEIDINGAACRGRSRRPQIPTCRCNELGSRSPICDALTNRCRCKKGVVGHRCDRCNTTYWGLRTNQGCKPCSCNTKGSSRQDCDQMTGQCVCKPGVDGQRCDRCPGKKQLTDTGCEDISVIECQRVKCAHGAVCKYVNNVAECFCDIRCEENQGGPVCGQDGQTYQSECALKKENCKRQKTVLTDYAGNCEKPSGTAHDAGRERPVYADGNSKKAYRLLSADEKSVSHEAGTSFGIDSYLMFPSVMKMGRHIGINITLAPSEPNGLIFYNGPTVRHGDFISLSLKDGYVIFKFNLGSGELELRNRQRLSVAGERMHTIYIERRGKKGTLIVDSERPVIGKSPGKKRALDLKNNFVIGNMNNAMDLALMEKKDMFIGFKGCLLSFYVLNRRTNKQFNLARDTTPLSRFGTGTACIPKRPVPCLSNPCLNNGVCSTNYAGDFSCKCPDGSFGKRCEKNMKTEQLSYKTAEFRGNSLIKIPTKNFSFRKRVDLEIWFLAAAPDGLIALLSDEDGEHFLSVLMMKGKVRVIIRTNNGISMIHSAVKIRLNEWNKVVVKKGRKFLAVIVNGKRRSRARIVPKFFKSLQKDKRKMYVHFNVQDRPLFIGGYPSDILSSSSMGTDVWFKGAIQKVILNKKRVNLFLNKEIRMNNITEWMGPPCGPSHSLCGRGTVCKPRLNSASCQCVNPPCEHAMHDNPSSLDTIEGPINFDGRTLFKMKNMITRKVTKSKKNNIRVIMKTASKNGVVLYMGKSRRMTVNKDFLVLAVRNGRIELAINMAPIRGLIRIVGTKIKDNKWHTIHILRNERMVTLLIDGVPKTGYIPDESAKSLSSDGALWIGGTYRAVRGFPGAYSIGYDGCISHMYIDGEPVNFSRHVRVKRGRLAQCSIPFEF